VQGVGLACCVCCLFKTLYIVCLIKMKKRGKCSCFGAKGEVMAKIVSSSLVACVFVFLRKYKRDCERGQRKKRGCKVAAPTIGIRAKRSKENGSHVHVGVIACAASVGAELHGAPAGGQVQHHVCAQDDEWRRGHAEVVCVTACVLCTGGKVRGSR
jgi:hypothetical protein